ncbi:MAG: glycerate kinase, partial [Clostridia bacterium]|nr:glycerate kinase [Clostridia bacterium]
MNWTKFALGLRFAATEHEPFSPEFFWELLFEHLPASAAEGLYLHGIVDDCADREPEAAYVCVFSNASLKRAKRLFELICADSYLCSYLTVYRPFIQTNTLEQFSNAAYLGCVDESGAVLRGDVAYGSMRFSGARLPRVRSSRRMSVLIAPDSFKGTITSAEAARHLCRAAYRYMPLATAVPCLTADGGEGTLDAIICPRDGRYVLCEARDCFGNAKRVRYGVLPDQSAVIEAAQACGYIAGDGRDVMRASSCGLGDGHRRLEIALGGSAVNDGGMGMLTALGARFLDAEGRLLSGCGGELGRVASVETEGLHPALSEASIRLLCDVKNPLLGENGCAHVYARQKGADDAQIAALESGMENFVRKTLAATGVDAADREGAGAAGGLGYALMAYCGAVAVSG